ncbi:hypothetical protein BVRB_025740 [Beta vulgaris subsp. vulgaris]|uniref:Uncharacterized protein n=1 Tax=Beta vulgaris subsp. vulgaris TaxID=3555 RepID=A0A0J8AZ93_BETVV|nr:hypothetical protein BVRB_025740 [Beta vulgaris subsp. vulgaris]
MFSKLRLATSPLLSSALGGATAAAFTMLGAEKRLMQASFAAFIYYFVQVNSRS